MPQLPCTAHRKHCSLFMIAVLLMLVAGLSSPAPAAGPTGRIVRGEPFPNLLLPSLQDGTPLSISAFRGKKTLLHVFASW